MPAPHRPIAAAAWMAGAVTAFTLMAIGARAISATHDTYEIMLWRSVVGVALVFGAGAMTRRLREIRTDRLAQHGVRNLFHFAGQNLWFFALATIPLAQVAALEFTSPLWVILLAPLVLGERLTVARGVAAVLGFAGIWVVARPDFGNLDPGVLAAAGAAVCFAAAILMTKALTRGESIVSILWWLTVMQLVLGALCAGWDGDIRLPTAQTLPWLALIGLAGVGAHLCLTSALSLAPASVVVPMDFARLPVLTLVGILLYDETPDAGILLGAALILAANWINLRDGSRAVVQQSRVTEP